jgi:hypothetical protein
MTHDAPIVHFISVRAPASSVMEIPASLMLTATPPRSTTSVCPSVTPMTRTIAASMRRAKTKRVMREMKIRLIIRVFCGCGAEPAKNAFCVERAP